MRFPVILVILLNSYLFSQTQSPAISGIVVNSIDNSPIPGCSILIKDELSHSNSYIKGTATDPSGSFRTELPVGNYLLTAAFTGFKTFAQKIILSKKNNHVDVKISLLPLAYESKEVTITGEKKLPSTISQEIEEKDLQRMPTIYGDVMRAVQILPGVVSNNELSSGYNVRGGNFDDNLIYLNGFEIYRPFLLRQGAEENQTIINPDLANGLRFYNGSFPASYGDKMSSALEVNYDINKTEDLKGTARADFLNSGLAIKNKFGNLKIAAAGRYSYPGLFLNVLQTNGKYKPGFADIQVNANYSFNENNDLEIFILDARNKFNLTPTDWNTGFGGLNVLRDEAQGLEITYSGERTYTFNTGLAGLKYSSKLSNNILFNMSASAYNTKEVEQSNVSSDYFYLPDGYPDNSGTRDHIKTNFENVDNHLDLVSYGISPQIQINKDNHIITTGVDIKLSDVKNKMSEQFTDVSDSFKVDSPLDRIFYQQFNLNSYSAFLQDNFSASPQLLINAGVRTTYYQYNKEMLVSPRVNVVYILSPVNNITFSWGYYYQPPYYSELRNKSDISKNILKAQRAIHYSLGWEYQFKEKLKFSLDTYYKNLSNLIPYYIDREKTEYSDKNSNVGFAYGFDATVQGELVEGMNTWIGYGYLNTQEKNPATGEGYHPRPTDNRHSVMVFLQDKIKKHVNWQSHLRLLFNTGYIYNLREIVTDQQTGEQYIKVLPDKVGNYPAMYFRADMGLSANFNINSYNLLVVAEVLNVFNNKNYSGYDFVQVTKNSPSPYAIPQRLSSRFFNVGAELRF